MFSHIIPTNNNTTSNANAPAKMFLQGGGIINNIPNMNDNQRYLHTQILKTTLNTLNPVIVWDKERFLYHGYNFSKNMLKQICQTNGGPKLPESIKFFFVSPFEETAKHYSSSEGSCGHVPTRFFKGKGLAAISPHNKAFGINYIPLHDDIPISQLDELLLMASRTYIEGRRRGIITLEPKQQLRFFPLHDPFALIDLHTILWSGPVQKDLFSKSHNVSYVDRVQMGLEFSESFDSYLDLLAAIDVLLGDGVVADHKKVTKNNILKGRTVGKDKNRRIINLQYFEQLNSKAIEFKRLNPQHIKRFNDFYKSFTEMSETATRLNDGYMEEVLIGRYAYLLFHALVYLKNPVGISLITRVSEVEEDRIMVLNLKYLLTDTPLSNLYPNIDGYAYAKGEKGFNQTEFMIFEPSTRLTIKKITPNTNNGSDMIERKYDSWGLHPHVNVPSLLVELVKKHEYDQHLVRHVVKVLSESIKTYNHSMEFENQLKRAIDDICIIYR